ncbi:MAG: hypothetical protein RQ722_05380 [Desulfuromonadales bacterium]|nr:hypothetical protein [Desulfuromonadales bacterium]
MRFNRLESVQLAAQVKSVGQTTKVNMNTAFLFLDERTYKPQDLAEQGIMSEKC